MISLTMYTANKTASYMKVSMVYAGPGIWSILRIYCNTRLSPASTIGVERRHSPDAHHHTGLDFPAYNRLGVLQSEQYHYHQTRVLARDGCR